MGILGKARKQTTDPDAIKANIAHNFVTQRGFETIKAMVLCGEILQAKKQSLPHGKWIPWVRANLDFTQRTAQYYLKLYQHREKVLLVEPTSLLQAIEILSDTKRLTSGLLHADERILRRNLVSPIKVVRRRLKRLPSDAIHYETVQKILEEMQEEIMNLASDLGKSSGTASD